MIFPEVNGNAVKTVVAPEASEVRRTHIDDTLIARVIVKNRRYRERARPVRRREFDGIVFADAVATRETFGDEDARLLAETTHQLGATAVKELKFAALAGSHRH